MASAEKQPQVGKEDLPVDRVSHDTDWNLFEADAVAPGADPQMMQFPSPAYFVVWVSEELVVVGAGGGRRFGMRNLLVLLSVDSRECAEREAGMDERESGKRSGSSAPAGTDKDRRGGRRRPWKFLCSLDLGGDIPWCASNYAPCQQNDPTISGSSLGYFAVSHVTAFTVLEVVQTSGSIALKRRARIELPSDPDDPDKKPIRMVDGAVVVAHDQPGIYVYALRSLLRGAPEGTATNKPRDVVTSAQPVARWKLPARVNDLDANRILMVRRVKKRNICARNVRAADPVYGYTMYLVVVALVQDKTLRVGHMPLSRCTEMKGHEASDAGAGVTKRSEQNGEHAVVLEARAPPCSLGSDKGTSGGESAGGTPGRATCTDNARMEPWSLDEAAICGAAECRLPFSPTKGSLRAVKLFGLDHVPSAHFESACRHVAGVLCFADDLAGTQTTRSDSAPLLESAGFVVLVYDVRGHTSYLQEGRIFARWSVNRALGRSGSHLDAYDDDSFSGGFQHGRRGLQLSVEFSNRACSVVNDVITAIAPYYASPVAVRRGLRLSPCGAYVPDSWIAGTVEGALLNVQRQTSEQPTQRNARTGRAGADIRVVNKQTALHKEPVSGVAISSRNDVVSTDISQNAAVSVLPYYGPCKALGLGEGVLMEKDAFLFLFSDQSRKYRLYGAVGFFLVAVAVLMLAVMALRLVAR